MKTKTATGQFCRVIQWPHLVAYLPPHFTPENQHFSCVLSCGSNFFWALNKVHTNMFYELQVNLYEQQNTVRFLQTEVNS